MYGHTSYGSTKYGGLTQSAIGRVLRKISKIPSIILTSIKDRNVLYLSKKDKHIIK